MPRNILGFEGTPAGIGSISWRFRCADQLVQPSLVGARSSTRRMRVRARSRAEISGDAGERSARISRAEVRLEGLEDGETGEGGGDFVCGTGSSEDEEERDFLGREAGRSGEIPGSEILSTGGKEGPLRSSRMEPESEASSL